MPNTEYKDTQEPGTNDANTARKRLIWFGIHLSGYFLLMLLLVPLNFWLSPNDIWVLLPLVGWAAVLALHVAYVMGLFDIFRSN